EGREEHRVVVLDGERGGVGVDEVELGAEAAGEGEGVAVRGGPAGAAVGRDEDAADRQHGEGEVGCAPASYARRPAGGAEVRRGAVRAEAAGGCGAIPYTRPRFCEEGVPAHPIVAWGRWS